MEKFKNKYRIQTARASWWNYGWNGAYFITICTQNREHFFGEIIKNKMVLSNCGVLADVLWHEIPNHAHNIELGAFVVMPNHIHGILLLNNNNIVNERTEIVETLHATSLQQQQQQPGKKQFMADISPQSNSIPAIVRSYKSAVTKHANRMGFENGWQTRYHDHIIRNDSEYQRINDYIETNPMKWENDKFFKQTID